MIQLKMPETTHIWPNFINHDLNFWKTVKQNEVDKYFKNLEKCEKNFAKYKMAENPSLGSYSQGSGSKSSASWSGNPNGNPNGPLDSSSSTHENDRIPISSITPNFKNWLKLGQGSFGSVYKADHYGPVAIKVLNFCGQGSRSRNNGLNSFENEIKTLKDCNHASIVQYRGYIKEESPTINILALVMEYCEGKSLNTYIYDEPRHERDYDSLILSTKNWLKISISINKGMSFLEMRDIVHGDLKSENVFLKLDPVRSGPNRSVRKRDSRRSSKRFSQRVSSDSIDNRDLESVVKIGDFGLASLRSAAGTQKRGQSNSGFLLGTPLYMAPEIFRHNHGTDCPYTTKSDVYAFGMVLWEIFTKSRPFNHHLKKAEQNNHKINSDFLCYQIGSGNWKLDWSVLDSCLSSCGAGFSSSSSLINIIQKCVNFKPENRDNFHEILEDLTDVLHESEISQDYLQKNRSKSCFMINNLSRQSTLGSTLNFDSE